MHTRTNLGKLVSRVLTDITEGAKMMEDPVKRPPVFKELKPTLTARPQVY